MNMGSLVSRLQWLVYMYRPNHSISVYWGKPTVAVYTWHTVACFSPPSTGLPVWRARPLRRQSVFVRCCCEELGLLARVEQMSLCTMNSLQWLTCGWINTEKRSNLTSEWPWTVYVNDSESINGFWKKLSIGECTLDNTRNHTLECSELSWHFIDYDLRNCCDEHIVTLDFHSAFFQTTRWITDFYFTYDCVVVFVRIEKIVFIK